MLRKGALIQHQQKRNVNVFSEFTKSIRRQIEENKKLQKDIKLLSEEQAKVTESDAMKNAKLALSATSKATSKVIKVVGSAVDSTLETPLIKGTGKILYKTAETVADVSHKVADPIMDTKVAKSVASGIHQIKKDVIGTRNAYFAEYRPKEERERERLELQADKKKKSNITLDKNGLPIKSEHIEADHDASGMVMHRSGKLAEAWNKFAAESPIGQALHNYSRKLEENDSPILRFWRSLKEKTTISETETAKVIRAFKAVESDFDQHFFLKEVANYIIADLLEAYLSADVKTLKEWGTEGAFARMTAEFDVQKKAGLVSDCKLIDYRNVELSKLALLEDELPVAMIHFQTTEILCFKNKKGDIILGAEDNIQNARYAIAFTKKQILDPDAEVNPSTNGWIIMDWARVAT